MKINKKGVSLIVLIITIIVMLIIGGTIVLSLGNRKIITKANEAVEKLDEIQIQEIASVAWGEEYNKVYSATGRAPTVLQLKKAVEKVLENNNINVDDYSIKVTKDGVDIIESVIARIDEVPIPKGFVASQATGESTVAEGLVIYEGTDEVTDDNVEFSRITRNQYVWVPVDKESFETEFVRGYYLNKTYSNQLGVGDWEAEVEPITNTPYPTQSTMEYMNKTTLSEVQAMYASVKKHGGFYIARYEAGIDVQRVKKSDVLETTIYSIMNKIPYTWISVNGTEQMNGDGNGAMKAARSIYPEENNQYGVVSTLVYGVQWDATLAWFKESGIDLSNVLNGNSRTREITSASELNKGAKISDNILAPYIDATTATYPKASGKLWKLTTGALKTAKNNNIYDMAGNMNEWTMEGNKTANYIARGGSYTDSNSIANRWAAPLTNSFYALGFRVALYIK